MPYQLPEPAESSDSESEDGPLELPDGRLICRPHGFVVCGYCCVDYSFMDEVLELDHPDGELDSFTEELYQELSPAGRAEIDARWGPPSSQPNIPSFGDDIARGTGRVLPTKFRPPSATSTPDALFPVSNSPVAIPPSLRFIRQGNPEQVLFFTDGACSNNGQANPKAGWAFVLNPDRSVSGRLEQKGPFGDSAAQTSNRAELRAVLAVLRFRAWDGEGFKTIVFATDSEYVAEGATTWVRGWIRNGWRTHSGAEVKNKDLWEMLLGEVERWNDYGLDIQFWRIPRELNTVADHAAKQASREDETRDTYYDIKGVLI